MHIVSRLALGLATLLAPIAQPDAGLYDRSAQQQGCPPFDLPRRWIKRKAALRLATPFNFAGTHDIIGGNSGSPVVNRAGEFVGIIFDGNIHSLSLDFAYSDTAARSVSVHSAGILEALDKVYGARNLVRELKRECMDSK